MKRALYLGHKKSCVYDRKREKKRKTEIQRVKARHHVCVEGHMLKGKKRVTRLKYICIGIYMHLEEENRMYIHIKDETLNEGLRRGDGRILGWQN